MSGRAYIRHIFSIYSAYIAIRWKAGGDQVKNRVKTEQKSAGLVGLALGILVRGDSPEKWTVGGLAN
jgi:hypothetical protein